MSADDSITRWISELEEGGNGSAASDAQQKLWQRYFHRLIGLAKLKLGPTPRAVADEEDVATAALQSFFAGVPRGSFPQLCDRENLWLLLAKITSHKALDQQRYLLAEKRGGGNLRGESAISGASGSMADWPASMIEDELGPDFLAAMNEECDRLMGLLTDNELRQIARRRLEGYTNAEIAKELNVIERTVERRLQLIRSLWSEAMNAP